MIQWEYKTKRVMYQTDDNLNNFGLEGWELISVVFRYTSAGGYDYFDYYFKRQITENK